MLINNLPEKIAVFPLSNAVFFPNTILPLNIFEKRYLQLVDDCMKDQRLFGMIQPKTKKGSKNDIYEIGCLGKITSFSETEDNRYIINLSGLIRFRVETELSTKKLYREFKVDYSDFRDDLTLNKKVDYDTKGLVKKIKKYFQKKNYLIELQDSEWEKLNLDQLVSTVCMVSPFTVEEKQKLIETIKTEEKFKILEEIINFSLLDNTSNKTIQ
tara:strand:- start:538 stop:1176 length:639 start_codon:yes stop_codon:yes gene_type:complete